MPSQALIPTLAVKEIKKRLEELRNQPEKFVEISRKQACQMLLELRDQDSPEFFSVLFIRRHPKPGFPAERLMRSSFNIKKYLVGGPPKYDPADHNLFWVADIELLQAMPADPTIRTPYRSVNAETLLELTIRGIRYKIVQEGTGIPSDRR